MCIEPFRHHGWRNPVPKMHQTVECQHQIVFLDQFQKALLTSINGGAHRIQRFCNVLPDQGRACTARPGRARQDDAGFFIGFSDRRDPRRLLGARIITISMIGPGWIAVFFICLAAWKYERARGEVDFIVALHHEHLQVWLITQQKDGRAQSRCRGFRHFPSQEKFNQIYQKSTRRRARDFNYVSVGKVLVATSRKQNAPYTLSAIRRRSDGIIT